MKKTKPCAVPHDCTQQDRITWEYDVYEAMCELMDVTRSDAQAISDAVPDAMEDAWYQGKTPEEAAAFIDVSSKVQ